MSSDAKPTPKSIVLPEEINAKLATELHHMASTLVPIAAMPSVSYANEVVFITLSLAPLYTKLNTLTYVAHVRVANVHYFITKAAAEAATPEAELDIIKAYVGRAAADALGHLAAGAYLGTELLTQVERKEADAAGSTTLTVAIGANVDLSSVTIVKLRDDAPEHAPLCWEVNATLDIPVSVEVWDNAMRVLEAQTMRVMAINVDAAQNLMAAEATAGLLLSRVSEAAASSNGSAADDAPDNNPTH